MSLSQKLHDATAPIWQQTLRHPFVVGLGNGSLPLGKFQFYMCQDYVFLIEYSRVLALATAKATDLVTMERFAQLLDVTLNQEMALHRAFAQECGISADTLATTQAAPTTLAYTNHLLRIASFGEVAASVSALLPCQWGYSEIGQTLAKQGKPNAPSFYGKWIDMYASAEFAELSSWLREVLDQLAPNVNETQLRQIFQTSARYEYLFWDMAYQAEDWRV